MKPKAWQQVATTHPYYVVRSVPQLAGPVDIAAREAFFESGRRHVADLWDELAQHFGGDIRPARALDFGCGLGRVTIPLAERCGEVVGTDIAPAMVEQARAHAAERGVQNVRFVVDGTGSEVQPATFDLVHSSIVLQHVDPRHGYGIFERLVSGLRPGGIGALHVTYRHRTSRAVRLRHAAWVRWPRLLRWRQRIAGATARPALPMYAYDMARLLSILRRAGIERVRLVLTDDGVEGAMMIFRRG